MCPPLGRVHTWVCPYRELILKIFQPRFFRQLSQFVQIMEESAQALFVLRSQSIIQLVELSQHLLRGHAEGSRGHPAQFRQGPEPPGFGAQQQAVQG